MILWKKYLNKMVDGHKQYMSKPMQSECYAMVDGHELALDYFEPQGNANSAAVMFIHGGGWVNGSRQQFGWHAQHLAQLGYFSCSVSYRLSHQAQFPGALNDCQAALVWMRERAAHFKFSKDRCGVVGSSAGGQLAALLGTVETSGHSISTRANCVVDIHGIHNFPMLSKDQQLKVNRVKYLGGNLEDVPNNWKMASPSLYVDQYTAPMLLTHDPNDTVVPYDQTVNLAHKLLESGVPFEFIPTPGSGHGFVYNSENAWTQKIWPSVVSWLDKHLILDDAKV